MNRKCFRVARLDDDDLSEGEMNDIEKAITDDIRFDYTEDEVGIWFDREAIVGVLLVQCQDVEHEDRDDRNP